MQELAYLLSGDIRRARYVEDLQNIRALYSMMTALLMHAKLIPLPASEIEDYEISMILPGTVTPLELW
jgi:hypothetical protein